MKACLSILLSLSMSILFVASPVRSQNEPAQDGDTLKARIEQLENTDVKSKSPTVLLIYKRSLLRLYNYYSAALEQEMKDLKNIQTAVGESDSDTKREVAARIQKLTSERDITALKIETLAGDLRAATSQSQPGGSTPVAEQAGTSAATRYEPVSYPRAQEANANRPANTTTPAQPMAMFTEPVRAALAAVQTNNNSSGTPATTQTGNVIHADWATRTAGCPAKITSSTSFTLRVTNINNLLVDFETGDKLEYRVRAKASRVSAIPPAQPFATQAAPALRSACSATTSGEMDTRLESVRADVKNNPSISPNRPNGDSITWQRTLSAALEIDSVKCALNLLGQKTENDPIFQNLRNASVLSWLKLLRGGPESHSFDYTLNLEANRNYEFSLTEIWKSQPTNGGTFRWDCGEDDVFTLSVGPMISTLPSRTYDRPRVPVTPGSTTSQEMLTVGNSKNINVLGSALINYHFPRWRFLPGEMGLGLSAGPVYTLGKTPDVSALGLFVGPSIHLTRSIFFTPGFHIGEFADFPAGFAPGSVIPDQFGTLNPVKRRTAKFAFGITYKTNSFKKTTQGSGESTNAAGGSNSGQGSGSSQPTGGNPVSGSGQSTPGSEGSGGGRVRSTPTPTPTPRPIS